MPDGPGTRTGGSATPRPAFHDGERALHEAYGIDEKMARVGSRAIRRAINPEDAQFLVRRPFLALGLRDDATRPWATLVAGLPGWIAVPAPDRLAVRARPRPDDPAEPGLHPGRAVAALAIDFETANRSRINGRVTQPLETGFAMTVDEAYGNCPKYIRQRRIVEIDAAVTTSGSTATIHDDAPDADVRRMIEIADTFFIATGHADYGADVSHRGGPTGFVRFDSDDAFVFPDYRGNYFFNTLGNLVTDPRAGLCFFGPRDGALLQLTGRMQIAFEPPDNAPPGAERMWRFVIEGWCRRTGVLPLRFEDGEPSPYLPQEPVMKPSPA